MIQLPIEIGDVIRVGRFKNKRVTVKEIGTDEMGLPTINGRGILKIRIEKLMPKKENTMKHLTKEGLQKIIKSVIKELHNTDTEVKIKQVDGRWRICQTETDHYLDNNGYETKELAQHAALTKGYSYSGVEEELPDTVEVPKPTKREKTPGTDKPEELKLGKETEQKLESIIRKVIKEETGKKYVQMRNGDWMEFRKKGDNGLVGKVKMEDSEVGLRLPNTGMIKLAAGVLKPFKNKIELHTLVQNLSESTLKKRINEVDVTDTELEAKAREFAAIANKMKLLEEELKNLEGRYTELDNEFRPMLEQVGKTKGTFIRAGKLLIKIERAGYDRKSASYKTGFDYLYNKVNATMKDLAQEALKLTKTSSYVNSKLAVVEEGRLNENWFSKIKLFLSNSIKKLFGINNRANKELDELESKIS